MSSSAFKDRLIAARERAGLSQTELGQLCGMAPTQVSRYESGRAVPRRAAMARLAEALKTPMDWLMHGDSVSMEGTQIRFEQSESGDAALVLRPSPELGARMRQMADLAGITPNELLRRIIEDWARQRGASPEEVADQPYFADLRARVDRLEKALEDGQVTAVLTENTAKPAKKPKK